MTFLNNLTLCVTFINLRATIQNCKLVWDLAIILVIQVSSNCFKKYSLNHPAFIKWKISNTVKIEIKKIGNK